VLPRSVDILVVEDSPTQAARLTHVLKKQGFAVRHSAGARLAFDEVRRRAPDLLVSDVSMPEIDGFTLCQWLKQDPDLRHIPVLLLTGLAEPEDIVRGLEVGADCYLTKPYSDEELASRIEFVLANRVPEASTPETPLQVEFLGKSHVISSSREQMLSLLLSTYESSSRQNKNLQREALQLKMSVRELEGQLEDLALPGAQLESLVEGLPWPSLLIDERSRNVLFCNTRAVNAFGPGAGRLLSQLPEPAAQWDGLQRKDHELHVVACRWQQEDALLVLAAGLSKPQEDSTVSRWREDYPRCEAFLDALSTQLQDPLKTLRTELSALGEGSPETRAAVERCSSLVSQVEGLDLFAIESGPWTLQRESVQIEALLEQVVQSYSVRQPASQKHVTLACESAPPENHVVVGDGRRLQLALTHLIRNAIQHSDPGGIVYVSVERAGENVTITIRDEGPGIPEGWASLVFSKFFRGAPGGLGLGLFVARQIVDAHRGTLELLNEGLGTCLRITLP
jgi:DNA-binding response OmpR family regulator/nitrogen-specific signal transduction histidine kinase